MKFLIQDIRLRVIVHLAAGEPVRGTPIPDNNHNDRDSEIAPTGDFITKTLYIPDRDRSNQK